MNLKAWHIVGNCNFVVSMFVVMGLCVYLLRSNLSSLDDTNDLSEQRSPVIAGQERNDHDSVNGTMGNKERNIEKEKRKTIDTPIIVITPTVKKLERLADMTRLANTLSHIKNVFWIVVEDAERTSIHVERLLERSSIPHVYLSIKANDTAANILFYKSRESVTKTINKELVNGSMKRSIDNNSHDPIPRSSSSELINQTMEKSIVNKSNAPLGRTTPIPEITTPKHLRRINHKGWAQRDAALDYLRTRHVLDYGANGVVYFADDDNSYDLRLFNEYIRNVRKIGVWAVGLVGGSYVEAPKVSNNSVIGWHVTYRANRPLAIDMAGFGVNMQMLLQYPNANFSNCVQSPELEVCFLHQMNVTNEILEPFGTNIIPKDVLVWHTKTRVGPVKGDIHGYSVEK